MGGVSSYQPNAVDGSGRRTCLLAFPSRFTQDEIYILYGSSEVQSILREAILRNWPQGIDRERNFVVNFGSFKLHGKPFGMNYFNSSSRGIQRVRLMRGMVEGMLRSGWCLTSTINFHRHTKSDSFLFQRFNSTVIESRICALNLQSSDQIHLVGGPARLYPLIQQIIIDHWPAGLQSHKAYDTGGEYKFVMKQYPWTSRYIHENLANSRMVVLQVVRAIHREGYTLLSSGHPHQVIEEVDTLYFARNFNPEPMNGSFIFGVQKHDYLITVDAPSHCVDIVRQGIQTAWHAGLQGEEKINNMTAFKLRGNPWETSGAEASLARLLLITIFLTFRTVGWRLYATIDMNDNLDDSSCFVMVSCPPVRSQIFALKLSGTDFFRLINAPQQVVICVRQTLMQIWPRGVKEKVRDETPEFHFTIPLPYCQGVFCIIIEKLGDIGWRVLSSADLSVKCYSYKNRHYPIDLHTIFFEKIEKIES